MFPAFLGKAEYSERWQTLESLEGHCFVNINITTKYSEDQDGLLKAEVEFYLRESLGLCIESL